MILRGISNALSSEAPGHGDELIQFYGDSSNGAYNDDGSRDIRDMSWCVLPATAEALMNCKVQLLPNQPESPCHGGKGFQKFKGQLRLGASDLAPQKAGG